MQLRYEWDEAKNQANIAKHGLSFEDAEHVFAGPCVTFEDDPLLRLDLLAILAQASGALPDNVKSKGALSSGFELGVNLFEESFQARPTAAFDEEMPVRTLRRLTRLGIRQDSHSMLRQIRQTENLGLRALLLAEAARAMQTPVRR